MPRFRKKNLLQRTGSSKDLKKIFVGFPVRDYIEERAIRIGNYIIEHGTTVRQTAKDFGVSKSTVVM